jgi:hypothetical protein
MIISIFTGRVKGVRRYKMSGDGETSLPDFLSPP